MEQINFTRNLDGAWQTAMYFILDGTKETTLDFSQGKERVL